MRLPLCLFLLFATVALTACAPANPMSSEEFMGFCVQQDTGRYVCDNIGICGAYQSVFDTEQQSLGECLTQCQTINANQVRNLDPLEKCWYVSNGGENLCERHCREKFKPSK